MKEAAVSFKWTLRSTQSLFEYPRMRQWQFLCGRGIYIVKACPILTHRAVTKGREGEVSQGFMQNNYYCVCSEYGHDATVLGAVCMVSFSVNLNV